MRKIIGGYFGFEFGNFSDNPFTEADYFLLNSGRNALEFILQGIDKIETLFVPAYTCPVVLEPVKRLGINFKYYKIDDNLNLNLKILDDLDSNDYIIINNYFGIKDVFIDSLLKKYPHQKERFIIDGAQSLFYDNESIKYIFYSLPKFFGTPDGGLAKIAVRSQEYKRSYELLPDSTSYERCSHLMKRIDLGPEEGYQDFQRNTVALSSLKTGNMSRLTRSLLSTFNFEEIRNSRKSNFMFLHQNLEIKNKFKLNTQHTGPLFYPYLTDAGNELKKYLIKNKIFTPTFWPELSFLPPDFEIEKFLVENLVFLPIDHRYDSQDMQLIINKIIDFEK